MECGSRVFGAAALAAYPMTAKAVAPSTFAKPSVDSATALQIGYLRFAVFSSDITGLVPNRDPMEI